MDKDLEQTEPHKEVPPEKVIVLNEEIKKKLLGSFENYKRTMLYMSCDAPIEILCLPKAIETILVNDGVSRVYDLLDRDLTKIKGLGDIRRGELASRLNKFISMF